MTSKSSRPGVSVIGLGKLGACTAAALASRGMSVVGVDVDRRTVDAINAGRAPVGEPGLDELVRDNRERLRATSSHEDAVLGSDLTLILVPTPSTASGGFSLEHVRQAAAKVGRALARKPGYHVVVLVSTVLPGASEAEVIPVLEQFSGKRCGEGFGFCYAPEFIALGSVVRDFLNPDFVLIGEYDSRSGDLLESMYRHSCQNNAPIARMNIVNAELTKISVNTYVTAKISFANMLAELCSQLPGADVDVVTAAMGRDTRIGARYLTGAVSYGGPCFPRDNVALAYLARSVGANAALAEATHRYNLDHRRWLLDRVCQAGGPDATIAVVGLTYRPGTAVLEEAAGMWLARELVALGRDVVVYDEKALAPASGILGEAVRYAPTARAAAGSADVVVLMSPGADAAKLRAEDFANETIVLDCWRVCNQELRQAAHVRYVPLGVGSEVEVSSVPMRAAR